MRLAKAPGIRIAVQMPQIVSDSIRNLTVVPQTNYFVIHGIVYSLPCRVKIYRVSSAAKYVMHILQLILQFVYY